MALYSQTIKNLVAGVSQQPPILRYPEQLEEQINGFSTEADGLQRRPPSLHIAALNAANLVPGIKPKVHLINRDENEHYNVLFNGQGVSVYDLEGNPKTVSYGTGTQAYLQTINPRKYLKVVTIADYTFVANTSKPVEMTEEVTPDVWATQGALIHVKQGQYGRTYRVILNGTEVAAFATPDGSSASHTTQIDTNYIASQLAGCSTIASNGYTVASRGEGWLYITKNSGKITSVDTKDGFNNQAMFGFLTTTQKFTNLPATAPDNFTVLVKGEVGSAADDYYVKYITADKVWKECAKPNSPCAFNATTMPHVLIRQADGTFLFDAATWDKMKAGDDESNPPPSFVGNPIKDVFFYRNRLGLLAGENVILSKSGKFFQFWMSTATDVLDTDPIDLAASSDVISLLEHAVNFSDELLLWSDKNQFLLRADGVLSPKSAKIDPTTSFECSPWCKPVVAGRNAYFVSERALFSSIKEYYAVADVTNIKNAQDISAHVPSYVPNGVHRLMSSTVENILLALTEGEENSIFVYKYLFLDEQRVQSSWSKWAFSADTAILGGGFIGATLYLVMQRGSGLFLEKILFTYNTKDIQGEPYRVFLDRKALTAAVPAGAYNEGTDQTTVTLKGTYGANMPLTEYAVVTEDGRFFPVVLTDSNGTVHLPGNFEGQKLVVGETFWTEGVLSEIMLKTQDERGGAKADTEGRLQLKHAWLNYVESGYFIVEVEHFGKDTYVYEMTARMLGHTNNTLGALPVETGRFRFPIQSDSRNCRIRFKTKYPTPLAIIGAGWEGNYYRRSQRV